MGLNLMVFDLYLREKNRRAVDLWARSRFLSTNPRRETGAEWCNFTPKYPSRSRLPATIIILFLS